MVFSSIPFLFLYLPYSSGSLLHCSNSMAKCLAIPCESRLLWLGRTGIHPPDAIFHLHQLCQRYADRKAPGQRSSGPALSRT